MADVRAKLDDFKKLLDRVARHYLRMSTAGTAASAEAISRLYMAQEELGFDPLKPDEIDKLHDSLETATNIVSLALVNLPKIQRRNAWPSSEFVRLIRKALELGHVQHYQCSGFGETPSEPEPMPPFLIRVTRTRKPRMKKNRVPPFGEIVHIVSEASGGWSSDDAIRKYQQQRRVERLNTNKRGK